MPGNSRAFRALLAAIVEGDARTAQRLLAEKPDLATERLDRSGERFVPAIAHQLYAGDSALHVAAAAHNVELIDIILAAGAEVAAQNRLGAQPIHYAADASPGAPTWDPDAQAATVRRLVAAGADVDARTKLGVAPLHRAVRARCAAVVEALLDRGADPKLRNKSGSTPLQLATRATGRGGSGSAAAKDEQQKILRLLDAA